MVGIKGLTALLILGLVLSGCSGGGDTASTDTTSLTTGGTGGPGANGTAKLAVAFGRLQPDGAVPLTLNFTLFAQANGANVTSATWFVMQQQTANATGAATPEAKGARVQSGSTLPAKFALTFANAGTYRLTATVTPKNGNPPGNATLVVVASQPPPPPEKAAFFRDGAETDGSQFTITSNVYIVDSGSGTGKELDAEYPNQKWSQSDLEAHTGGKSWYSAYPDNYRTRLTTLPFSLPAAGGTLSYWIKGGAEDTSVEGLFVSAGPDEATLTQLAHHANTIGDWTRFSFPLTADVKVVQFRFDSDLSCSASTELPAGCGDGDLVGIWVDDILVQAV